MDSRWPFRGFDPHWIEVLMVLVKKREEEVLKIFDDLLARLPDPPYDQDLMRLLSKKILLLRAMDREVSGLLLEYPLSKWLRDTLIQEAVRKQDYPRSKLLVEQGIQAARRKDVPLYHHWQDMAFQLAEQFDDVETYRYYANIYYWRTRDLHYYRRLKDTYTVEEWPTMLEANYIQPLEKVMPDPRATPDHLARIYAEEQDWPRLLGLLQRKPDFVLVQLYANVLAPHYPAELLALFRRGLLEYADDYKSKHAEGITEIYEIVRTMRGWPGGRKVVTEMIDEFQRVFPMRKRLLEALARLR